MPQAEDLVRIGVVVRPHGIRGELVVEAFGDTLEQLPEDGALWLLDPPQATRLLGMRPHQGRWLVTLEQVGDRDEAERLRGRGLGVPAAELPAAPTGQIYVDDLVGCRLEDASGVVLGTVLGVQTSGPQDLLEVEVSGSRTFVPMARDWLVEVDLSARRLVMNLPPGLLDVGAGGTRS